jgi:cytochrome c biogenesis protein
VTDATGKQLFANGVPLEWQTNDGRTLGTFDLPDKNLTVYVVGHQIDFSNDQTDPLSPGQMDVELYDRTTGSPVAQQRLDQRTAQAVDGLSFTFDREMEYSNLAIARDPGAGLIWLGAALLAGGFMVVFFLPSRRVWARMVVGPDGRGALSLAAPTNNHFGADGDYASLVSDLRAACASPLSA